MSALFNFENQQIDYALSGAELGLAFYLGVLLTNFGLGAEYGHFNTRRAVSRGVAIVSAPAAGGLLLSYIF